MRTKPIAGPWVIIPKKLDTNFMGIEFPFQQVIAEIRTDDGFKIAEVFDTALPGLHEANSRLISMSPEMYECLKSLVHFFDGLEGAFSDNKRNIKDIINKIEGNNT